MKRFPIAIGLLLGLGLLVLAGQVGRTAAGGQSVTAMKTPDGGIQPQAVVDGKGVVHVVYLKGEPGASDVFYVRRAPGQTSFTAPIRVNSRPGSAVAAGTIRGAQIAIGKGGRVHVAWNGSREATPASSAKPAAAPADHHGPGGHPRGHGGSPMLYTRMNDAGTAFEPQRNLMNTTFFLDGGGTLAADDRGNVMVAWHAADGSGEGEQSRRMWIARSRDDGKTFARETPAFTKPTGACACCGTRAYTDRRGNVYMLYRTASTKMDRDMYLLVSTDRGDHFEGALIHPWKVPG